MKKSDYVLKSFENAGGVLAYVSLLALFFSNAQNIFGNGPDDKFIIPIFMLLLFIISATVTGFLVLGKPIILYMKGLQKEAFILLFATLGWLVAFILMIATVFILG
jgi:hypothetical protein